MYGGRSDEQDVEEDLNGNINSVDWCERDFIDEHRTKGVEKDLEGAEEGLAEERVEKEGFEGGGEICIEAVDTKGFVVC